MQLIAEKNIVSTTDIALCMIFNAYLRQLIIFEQRICCVLRRNALSPAEINNAKYYNNQPQSLFNVTTYLEYNKTGVRINADSMMQRRFRNILDSLVFAECVSYNGTYLNRIEEYLNGLCDQPSWVYTEYDKSANYSYLKGTYYFVDLLSGIYFNLFNIE